MTDEYVDFLTSEGLRIVDSDTKKQLGFAEEKYELVDTLQPQEEMSIDEAKSIIRNPYKFTGAEILCALRYLSGEICSELGFSAPTTYGLFACHEDADCDPAGIYDTDTNVIAIQIYKPICEVSQNYVPTNHNSANLAFNFAHEIYHGFQFAQYNLFADHMQKQHPEWRNEYIYITDNSSMYELQPVEIDADEFALRTVKELGFKIEDFQEQKWRTSIDKAKKRRPMYDEFIKTYKKKEQSSPLISTEPQKEQ